MATNPFPGGDRNTAVLSDNGWDEYRRYVTTELTRLGTAVDRNALTIAAQYAAILVELAKLQVCVGRLQVKAGIWGGVAGLIAAGVAIAAVVLRGGP